LNGKQLVSKIITSSQTIVRMKNLVQGTYFLKVKENNSVIKTFKIIKN